MTAGGAVARRLPDHVLPRSARRARRALRQAAAAALAAAGLALASAAPAAATPPDIIVKAEYSEPTSRYAHGVLGDAVEWGALVLTVDPCLDCSGSHALRRHVIRLPQHRVFEDLAPRLIAGDDGVPLAMVVESDAALGARLALYDERGLYAATPFIGRANRWLAPVGAADLDGDGWPELAYVDRPHLAKTLRIWRLRDGALTEIASKPGLTNHRIGEDFITSGIRDCGAGPEIVTADAGWSRIIASRLEAGGIASRDIGAFGAAADVQAALACE